MLVWVAAILFPLTLFAKDIMGCSLGFKSDSERTLSLKCTFRMGRRFHLLPKELGHPTPSRQWPKLKKCLNWDRAMIWTYRHWVFIQFVQRRVHGIFQHLYGLYYFASVVVIYLTGDWFDSWKHETEGPYSLKSHCSTWNMARHVSLLQSTDKLLYGFGLDPRTTYCQSSVGHVLNLNQSVQTMVKSSNKCALSQNKAATNNYVW